MKILTMALLIATVLFSTSCASGPSDDNAGCKSAFLEIAKSGEVNSSNGLAIAPGYGSFVVTHWIADKGALVIRECKGGVWSPSRPIYSDDEYFDYQPTFSEDGARMYFTSTRPIIGSEPVRQNVWVARRKTNFAQPAPIEALVSPGWDGHAVELQPGRLLYASERSRDDRLLDIFEAEFAGAEARITPADPVNSEMTDNDMTYNYHSGVLIYSRYDPITEDINLFYTDDAEGTWRKGALITALTTPQWEMSPAFTPDGEHFLFKRGDEPFQIMQAAELTRLLKGK